jgi:hypothetical protein
MLAIAMHELIRPESHRFRCGTPLPSGTYTIFIDGYNGAFGTAQVTITTTP